MKKLRIFFSMCVIGYVIYPLNVSALELRDPTEPAEIATSSNDLKSSEFNLQSILISANRRLVMINGETVGVGSEINGARVLAINKNHVILFYLGRKINLDLFGRRLWSAH